MSNFKHYGKRFLGTLALLLFIIVVVIWAYIFIRDPQLAGGWKKVIVPILELVFLGIIGRLLKEKLVRYTKETKNITAGLVKLISEEWVIQVPIWGVLIITSLHIILTMPVYKIVVDIEPSADVVDTSTVHHHIVPPLSIPDLVKGFRVPVELKSIDQPFKVYLGTDDLEESIPLELRDTARHIFSSKRLLRGGQEISIRMQTKEFVKVIVSTEPKAAEVWIRKANLDSIFCPDGICTAEKGETFTILITADKYVRKETSFVRLEEDTTIDVWLEPRPGFIKFNLTDLGGRPIQDMDVYIDEGKLIFRGYSSGQSITLKPDRHSVYMEKRRGNKTYYTDTHYFQIESGQTRVETCIVKTRSSPP